LVEEKHDSSNFLLIFSLSLARFVTQPHAILLGLLLIDIGLTFNYSIGIVGQLKTASNVVAMVFAVLAGAFSVRYSPKSIMLFGSACIVISAIGCYLAPDFTSLLIIFSLSGIGFSLIGSMSSTAIGEYLPAAKRAGAIGILTASLAVSYLVSSQVINYLSGVGGWRVGFLWYIFPISTLALIGIIWGIPNKPKSKSQNPVSVSFFEGFKAVFSNSSAIACLLGYTSYMVTWNTLLLFNTSYLRQVFDVSLSFAAMITVINSLSYIFGSLICSRMVKRINNRKTAALSSILVGGSFGIYFILNNLYLTIALAIFICIMAGIFATAGQSLALEQVPKFRGTMMSLNSASISLGGVLSSSIGGLILIIYNYSILGYLVAIVSVLSFIIYFKFAKDPIRITSYNNEHKLLT